ncbi:sensor histidine kinase [Enterococcus sp. CSURQ0835]|uniref:sensor histidine kinase n=1 Tax=Enterococcus sp. CSURQ0835 TaxID=2681394 RepID=UPI001359A690|nr:GHKL domain-containing protein [Enterococcus sp. CSURQ0835]
MIQIESNISVLRLFIDSLFFYGLFLTVNNQGTSKKRVLVAMCGLPITFMAQFFNDLAEMIPILFSYLLLKTKGKNDYVLLNDLLICMSITYIVSIFSSMLILFFVSDEYAVGFNRVFIQLFFKSLIIGSYLFFYKKKLYSFVGKYSSQSTSFLLLYLFLMLFLMLFLIPYAAHYYNACDHFVIGLIVFLVIQTGIVLFLFFKMLTSQKENYRQQLEQQQLISLKKYTERLEQSQEQLIKFRHDYKNLLLSLKEAAELENNSILLNQIINLEVYSATYLSNKPFDYSDFNNLKNDYLKSLLISKFDQANEQKVSCQFECSKAIADVPIPIFDCVRIMGILLDNAIEAARESHEMSLSLMIYQDESQLEFLIENSYHQTAIAIDALPRKGLSTKEGHSGIGLHTIQDFNKKNPNMFIQY